MSKNSKMEHAVRRAMEVVKSMRLKKGSAMGLDSFPAPRKGKKGTTTWLEEWKPLEEI